VASRFFDIQAEDAATGARAGRIRTAHGVIETPAFMPVGTAATVKGMRQEELEGLGVQVLLANTYHLYLRPGHEQIRGLGGLHKFMSWPHPILTDSGGYQVMSLKGLSRVTEDGVTFRSHLDGSLHALTPERAVEIQLALGSDILMCLDECVEYPASPETASRAARLTGRWARRAKEFFLRNSKLEIRNSKLENRNPIASPRVSNFESRDSDLGSRTPTPDSRLPTPDPMTPALFGIIQGGTDLALRKSSAEEIVEMGFDGHALGGLSVGEPKSLTYDIAARTAELLPVDRPRYLMGVGTPEDLVHGVAAGVDLFDCVLPTRNARNGMVFTSAGRLVVKSARYAGDSSPLDPNCACAVCQRYSRGYLRHLFQAGEILAAILATHHNLYFYLDTMRKIRQALFLRTFERLCREVVTRN